MRRPPARARLALDRSISSRTSRSAVSSTVRRTASSVMPRDDALGRCPRSASSVRRCGGGASATPGCGTGARPCSAASSAANALARCGCAAAGRRAVRSGIPAGHRVLAPESRSGGGCCSSAMPPARSSCAVRRCGCDPAGRRCWRTPRRADRSSPRARRRRSRRLGRRRRRRRAAASGRSTAPSAARSAAAEPIAAGDAGAPRREQLLHAVDHHLRLERLDQHAVAADRSRARPRRPARTRRSAGAPACARGAAIALDERRDLVAVALRHADVGQDDVRAARSRSARSPARPSPTTTTSMSSSANVSSMTRWMVTLSSASSSLCGMGR